jgi:hypothetical protein
MKECYAFKSLLVKRLSNSVITATILAFLSSSAAFSQAVPYTGGSSPVAQPANVKPVLNPGQLSFLPGTLVDWAVKVNKSKVSISWSTTIEKNSSRFIVLKSLDGEHYTEAVAMTAAGNSDKVMKYTCADNVFATKGLVYYRLKMVDKDQEERYSSVIVVRSNDENTELALYPNPAVNELRVTVASTWQGKEVIFNIYNNYGLLVKNKRNAVASQTETMNVTDLPAGIYIVKVSSGGEGVTRQFIKSKS